MTKTERIEWLELENEAMTEVITRIISDDEIAARTFVRTVAATIAEAEHWAEAARKEAKRRIVFEDDAHKCFAKDTTPTV